MTNAPSGAPCPEWEKKAFSFLVRSRQELWGKHNENILAWLFRQGLRNHFAQDMLLGWNRSAKIRPAKAWGLIEETHGQETFLLPPGLVIPFFQERRLRKLIIHDIRPEAHCCPVPVLGGSFEPIVWGENKKHIVVVSNSVHALVVHQELPGDVTVIVPHPDTADVPAGLDQLVARAQAVWFFPDPGSPSQGRMPEPWRGIRPDAVITCCEKAEGMLDVIRSALTKFESVSRP